MDNGIDKNHPTLAGKIVSEACYSRNREYFDSAGTKHIHSASLCPNKAETQIGSGAGVNCSVAEIADCSHGTHVAGIAAGVAKDAKLISIQVFTKEPCFLEGGEFCLNTFSDLIVSGLKRVYDLRNTYSIAAVNMSLAYGWYNFNCDNEFPSFKVSIDLLRSVGIPTIAAAGNDYQSDAISNPACISSAISVASTTKQDEISVFSNISNKVDLLAPGDPIRSTIPGGGFGVISGTSQAAPHVAGSWAVLKSAIPTVSVFEALSTMKSTGIPITDIYGNITKPRIQVDKALAALQVNVNTQLFLTILPGIELLLAE